MRKSPECSKQRCHRRVVALDLCRTHLVAEADSRFKYEMRVRDGRCLAAPLYPSLRCLGTLQAMHLVSATYHALRWEPENIAAGCAAHHVYLTEHPLEHAIFCEEVLGRDRWEALRARRFDPPMDPVEVVLAYRGGEAEANSSP